jgi:hypothetical protein
MKRILKKQNQIINPLADLSVLSEMYSVTSSILTKRIKLEEATISQHHYEAHQETDDEKDRRLVKESIDSCISGLQNIQTKLMSYQRNLVSWFSEESIQAMRRSINNANRIINSIIESKKEQDTDFLQMSFDSKKRFKFAKWAIDSAYKVAQTYPIALNPKLKEINKDMIVDHPELKPLEVKDDKGNSIGIFPLLIEF